MSTTLTRSSTQQMVSQPPVNPVQQATDMVAPAPTCQDDSKEKKLAFYMVLTSLFLMWSFFYIVFQALNPWITQQGDCNYRADACEKRPPDNAKCFAAALIVTVIVFLFLWLIVASLR